MNTSVPTLNTSVPTLHTLCESEKKAVPLLTVTGSGYVMVHFHDMVAIITAPFARNSERLKMMMLMRMQSQERASAEQYGNATTKEHPDKCSMRE